MSHHFRTLLISATMLAGVLPTQLPAAEPAIGNDLSVSQIIQRLIPPPAERSDGDAIWIGPTRKLGLGSGAVPPDKQFSVVQPDAVRPPSIDFQVRFQFNSAELTPEAMELLDKVGQALQSNELAPFSFRIVGHTDAVGSDSYNKRLSERRAASVSDYLAGKFKIDRSRLNSIGLGKEELLDPAHPKSSINRRVQIVNIGSN